MPPQNDSMDLLMGMPACRGELVGLLMRLRWPYDLWILLSCWSQGVLLELQGWPFEVRQLHRPRRGPRGVRSAGTERSQVPRRDDPECHPARRTGLGAKDAGEDLLDLFGETPCVETRDQSSSEPGPWILATAGPGRTGAPGPASDAANDDGRLGEGERRSFEDGEVRAARAGDTPSGANASTTTQARGGMVQANRERRPPCPIGGQASPCSSGSPRCERHTGDARHLRPRGPATRRRATRRSRPSATRSWERRARPTAWFARPPRRWSPCSGTRSRRRARPPARRSAWS